MRILRIAIVVLLAAALVSPAGGRPDDERPSDITKGELRAIVKTLASDKLEGREAGSPGCYEASDLIADEFKRLGLEPLGTEGTYFQRFERPRGMRVLPTSALSVTDAKGRETAFRLAVDFSPLYLSAKGEVKAEVVFAGYGISAPERGYDDYAGLDVKGKVVVVLRRAPAYQNKKSPFFPQGAQQRWASFQAKADLAAAQGAAALIVVNDPLSSRKKDDDVLRPPGGTATGKLPVVHMTWRAGRKLGPRIGVKLQGRQKQIDGKMKPRSQACPGVVMHVKCDLEPDLRRMRNVVGLLKAAGAEPVTGAAEDAPQETVIVGAHHDHVGRGRFGSLANANGKIHNGADDNASGTSALLEIAGYLADRRGELKRQILFITFSGEELGLWGSKHYVSAPVIPLAQCVAMLNLDMVGRLNKNRLFVGGTGTAPIWPEMLDRHNKERGKFKLTRWPGGKAPSDHTSFYERDMPVLFFFTGLHGDYHRPSDDWKTLEYRGHARVAKFAADIALELATRPDRPQFTRCDAGGFTVGPYTGLAVEQRDDGVYVAHVDKRSPASRAQIKAGDKLVSWNGNRVANTNRYNEIVSRAKPGDKADVVVSRKGRTRKLKLKMGRSG